MTLILSTIDRIKEILGELEATEPEPDGSDADLIDALERMVEQAIARRRPVPPAPQPARGCRRHARSADAGARRCAPAKSRSTIWSAPSARPSRDVDPRPPPKRASRRRRPAAAARKAKLREKPRRSIRKGDETTKADKVANQSIRVNVDTLEHLMTMVSELVLTRNQLLEIVRRHSESEFKVPLQRLSNVTAELQEGVMKTRMQPIGNAWQKLPRIVRDLSGELGKQIELEMHGADTELDRQVLDLIKDPLTHMVRNSADHGLETPEERAAAGKPEQGTIRLSAYHEGGHIIIEHRRRRPRPQHRAHQGQKALENGLASEAELEKMTEAQIHKFIFAPGFSTASAQVTNGLRPRRRHGRGAQQYRPDRRHRRCEVGAGRRARASPSRSR